MQCHDICNALCNDALKNEVVLYALRMHMLQCMKCEMLLKCIFVPENKSLTNAGETWEIKSWTASGDE